MISKLLTPLSSSQLQVNHKVMSMNFDRYHLVWGLLDSRKRKPGSGATAGEVTRCDPEQTFRVSTEFRMSLALGQKKKTTWASVFLCQQVASCGSAHTDLGTCRWSSRSREATLGWFYKEGHVHESGVKQTEIGGDPMETTVGSRGGGGKQSPNSICNWRQGVRRQNIPWLPSNCWLVMWAREEFVPMRTRVFLPGPGFYLFMCSWVKSFYLGHFVFHVAKY